jgi:hypothetical protein
VFCAGVPVSADGEDVVGRDDSADRALVAARVAGYRALRPARDEVELELLKAAARQLAGELSRRFS